MTTRSQKRKAVEELVSTEIETPMPETTQNLNPVEGTSKSRVLTENLEEIKSSLRKEIMSDLTKTLAENQKEMLKLIAPPVKKQTIITATEETDSESENIPENATSTPIKNKTTATTRKITPVNSRNMVTGVLMTPKIWGKRKHDHTVHKACHPTNDPRHRDYYSLSSRKSIHHLNLLQCQKPSPHLCLCLMVSPKNSNFSRTYFETT